MNTHSEHERRAAELLATEAIAHAKTYAGDDPEDVTAAATSIILTTLELLTPHLTPEQRRESFFREDQE